MVPDIGTSITIRRAELRDIKAMARVFAKAFGYTEPLAYVLSICNYEL